MTDRLYAARVYCVLFRVHMEKAIAEMNEQGVMDAIKLLDERRQKYLELCYRYDMSYVEAGKKAGVSSTTVRTHAEKAIRILRHPANTRHMRMEKQINDNPLFWQNNRTYFESRENKNG